MSWMDDLKVRAEQALNDVKGGISEYLAQAGSEAVVKIAAPRTGNLTAAQIAAGQRGAPPAMVQPVQVAQAAPAPSLALSMPVMLAIAGVAAFLILQRRRG